ncbi:hypothetical protein STXM2123_4523 [Streptomyces sp. F-3]|nr:hypothetical protein STXM2123_4523 [Streptomyces sp. F-3]
MPAVAEETRGVLTASFHMNLQDDRSGQPNPSCLLWQASRPRQPRTGSAAGRTGDDEGTTRGRRGDDGEAAGGRQGTNAERTHGAREGGRAGHGRSRPRLWPHRLPCRLRRGRGEGRGSPSGAVGTRFCPARSGPRGSVAGDPAGNGLPGRSRGDPRHGTTA